MMLKVFDFVRSALWYVVDFIYGLIDNLFIIIKKLNAIDIVNTMSNNVIFSKFYKGIFVISITLLSLYIIWKLINKIFNQDDEISINMIISDSIKCVVMILMSTFLFSQVSIFSIKLSNYTSNIFDNTTKATMSSNMLTMFITYKEGYVNSNYFDEQSSISELVNSGVFNKDDRYLEKYISKNKLIFDEKDYKYNINWILAILCGGFFLYSLFFASIMLGRRQIEFLFLFMVSPIVFSMSVCNKQRRGAVIEQLVSLLLQSSVVMLIVNLAIMVMQQVSSTTFFTNPFQNIIIKVLLYLGCSTFILTGSQIVNKFIGANISASNGREQIMSLIGYGRMFKTGASMAGTTAIATGALATGATMKSAGYLKNKSLTNLGASLNSYGNSSSTDKQTRMQKISSSLGNKMFYYGQKGINNANDPSRHNISDKFINTGINNLKSIPRKMQYNNFRNRIY